MCEEGLCWNCIFVRKFIVYCGENLNVNLSKTINWFYTRTLHQLSISDEEMLLLTGKIEKDSERFFS